MPVDNNERYQSKQSLFTKALSCGIKPVLLLFIFTFSFLNSFSQSTQQQAKIDSLINKISVAQEDTQKLKSYIVLFRYYLDVNPLAGLQYQKEAVALAEKLDYKKGTAELYTIIGRVNWITGNFEDALKNHFDALKIYEEFDNDKEAATLTTFIGQDYADWGKYSEALKYFNLALKKYEELGDKGGEADSYLFFAFVYGLVGNTAEAAKANYKALKIFESIGNEYSIAITTSNLADNYIKLGKYDVALSFYEHALVVLKKSTDRVNLSGIYISIGNIYSTLGKMDKAKENYLIALEIGKEINCQNCKGQAYANLGLMHNQQGDLNAALENYFAAEQMFQSVSNNQQLATVCNEVGLLYLRLNNLPKANEYFEKSFSLLEVTPNAPILENYYSGVQLLDSARGDWKNAYLNFRQYINYRDSNNNEANTKASMQTVLQYEFDKKEAAAKVEQEKKDVQQRTIRNSISAGLAGALIFLVVVYRQRNKISKARKRSDELLLNILPSEVADELKEKGRTEAKHFDEVTVMFTDFKGFTQISEKLSPTELVAELDLYFKAFDNIIGKYNIEKIKTIGDAYMCAGGLPVTNKTNANDMINAALEIQQFMVEHNSQRKNEKREVFEIRIGIHSGPVVAGIVGVKKFAYDIWGDTVNIASRMEQNSEAGKINISGYTYELVKDKFNCIYRGKIDAKNKGEIDMYFVDSIS